MIIFGLSSNSMFTAFVDETKLGNNFYEMVNLQYMTDNAVSEQYQTYTKSLSKVTKINNVDLTEIYNTVDGSRDMWLLKYDSEGNLIWQKTYGGTEADHAVIQ